jgi:putative intracellular protease/amidase
MRVLVAIPECGFDPTELGVPCRLLLEHGVELQVATPNGGATANADPIMITGEGLYLLKFSMRADVHGKAAYEFVRSSGALDRPLSFAQVLSQGIDTFDGLLLPGGHCPDMKPYLEDVTLQTLVSNFTKLTPARPVAAVCHGVVVLARSGVLSGKTVTALPSWMESLAYNLTRMWMGTYYKTYPNTSVQAEVSQACETYLSGPKNLSRDSPQSPRGFVVVDGSLVTARWPGDCHAFAHKFLEMLHAMRR